MGMENTSGMQELMKSDQERMDKVAEMVEYVKGCIEADTDDKLLQEYLQYKIGGRLLMGVLENLDKQVMAQELQRLGLIGVTQR